MMNDVIKRVKLIEACISLQDHQMIELQLPILQSLTDSEPVLQIIQLLIERQYVAAQQQIEYWLQQQHGLVQYEDNKTSALRLELKLLEQKLQDSTLQRDEAQNCLQEFNREYHLQLGAILRRILALQEEIAAQKLAKKLQQFRRLYGEFSALNEQITANKLDLQRLDSELTKLDCLSADYDVLFAQYQPLKQHTDALELQREAIRQQMLQEFGYAQQEESYQQYQQAHEQTDDFEAENEQVIQKPVANLSKEEIKALKQAYRKASKLCHPDLVSAELKEHAHLLMIQVNEAYTDKNLAKLLELLAHLESGGAFTIASDTIMTFDMLLNKLNELKACYQQVEAELDAILGSHEYITVLELGEAWDEYFADQRQALEQLAQSLEQELESLFDEPDHFAFADSDEAEYGQQQRAGHEVTGFWRKGHWRDGYWVRGHWVKPHSRG